MSRTSRILMLGFFLPMGFLPASAANSSKAGWSLEVQDEEEVEEPVPPARQNFLLRAYFRKQYLQMRTDRFDLNESFMERYIDRQIDHFVEVLEELVERLKGRLELAEAEHTNWSGSRDTRNGHVRFSRALKELGDTAGDIRGKLSHVFFQLDSKERLPIEIAAQSSYQNEMSYLRTQVEEAVSRIRAYMFDSTYTVPVQNLKKENMLIRLYWAEKTADGIRDQLPG